MNRRIKHAIRTLRGYSRRKQVTIVALITLLILLLIPVGTYAYLARDINDRDRLMNRSRTGLSILDKDGQVIYSYGRINQQDSVKLSQIPDYVEEALLASEDKDFYKHPGVSFRAMALALYGNILNKDPTRFGGSTITQQLVRNTLLSSGKNFLRKYQEFYMAIAVERQYTKGEILEMYLNSVYFGEGAFGIGPAARTYFGKEPQDLTLAEGSMLIGVLPAPSLYSPISGDADEAKKQQVRVLNQMVELGKITAGQREEVVNQELAFKTAPTAQNNNAKHFVQMVIAELNERYGEERVIRSGFAVTTGLDLDWQKTAEDQVRRRVNELSRLGGTNASLVAIDPRSGHIRALVGSVDWDNQDFGKVNMAMALRQPGSSFKPIFYAEALDSRVITPATILHDEPKSYGTYKPQNYDFRYMGDITTRRALALSRNLTAIEVMQKLGVDRAARAARDMGLSSVNQPDKYGLTLGVGTAEVRLIDMVNAYAAFANGGRQFTPTSIVSIKDKFDDTVYTKRSESKQVQSKEASFLISSILSDTQARAPTFNSLNIAGRQVAAKTGTTDNNRDAWTIGYTPSVSVGVWVGNNENRPMGGVAGASGAGPIWRRSMEQFLRGSERENFVQPSGVTRIMICSDSGLRAVNEDGNTHPEFFIRGTEPRQTCNDQRDRDEDEERKKEEEKKKEEKKDEDEDNGGGPGPPPPPPTEPPSECSDDIDNDNDGWIDEEDPGCDDNDDEEPVNPPPD
jgi:1A family penicillin-binding protein